MGHYTNQPPLDADFHSQDSLEDLYQQVLTKAKGAKSVDGALNSAIIQSTSIPNYIEAGSLESKRWVQTHERTKLVSAFDYLSLNDANHKATA
jgi:hypothetical protein